MRFQVSQPLVWVLMVVMGHVVAAQNSTSSPSSAASALLSKMPVCAQSCLKQGLAVTTCSPTDQKCTCSDETYLAKVQGCVLTSCTIKESMVTKNITQTLCGAPVRDRGQSYNDLTIALITIGGILVAVRMGFKQFIAEVGLGWDDWFILVTMFTGVASAILTVHGTVANGLGRDVWTLQPYNITDFGMYFYIMAVLYVTQVALLKTSLLFFYLRIFPERSVKRILWGLLALNGAFGVTFALLAIFQCQPINYFWNKWDGEHAGKCLNINGIAWANAAVSIVIDVLMLAVPMWQVFKLHLHWKKKVGVGIMFCTGTFVTIVSIIRLQTILSFANSSNPTWDNYDVSVWSSIEICVGIICACMPTLRLIIVRFFPRLSGSSGGHYYNNYGASGASGPRSGVATGSKHTHLGGRSVVSSNRTDRTAVESSAGSGATTPSGKGTIMMQQTFDVMYDESDETRLVELQNLPGRTLKGEGRDGHVARASSSVSSGEKEK